MPTTPGGLRYPASSDTPDVPRDIENLADDVESALGTKLNAADGIAKAELTAKGSILAASADSVPEEIPIGTNGQVLVADSTAAAGASWQDQTVVDPIPLILALS